MHWNEGTLGNFAFSLWEPPDFLSAQCCVWLHEDRDRIASWKSWILRNAP